jgi:putative ABC transport system permease protein
MTLLDLLACVRGAFTHRVRAALTLLGVVIGTSSIVLLASLLHGGESFLVHANQEASDEDIVEAHKEETPPAQHDKTTRPLSRADADALALGGEPRGSAPRPLVAAESSTDTYARFAGRKKRVAVVSTGPSTLALYRLRVEHGRALDGDDRQSGRRVCVIGHEIHEELLKSAGLVDAAGQGLRVEIDGRLFSVVGVLAKKPMLGATDSTYLWDRKVMVPETTYDALYAPSHEVQKIYVRRGEAEGKTAEARSASRARTRSGVRSVLLERHLGVLNFALAKDESGGTEKLILTVIQVLLLGTGVLALLASGINIMNVMLVTVSERTREIGLRRAIGASRRSILAQFLLEATALSFAGALLGVAFGIVLAGLTAMAARAAIGHWDFAIRPWSLALGVGMAVVTGLAFGILPAWRAARVSPIDALRSE